MPTKYIKSFVSMSIATSKFIISTRHQRDTNHDILVVVAAELVTVERTVVIAGISADTSSCLQDYSINEKKKIKNTMY